MTVIVSAHWEIGYSAPITEAPFWTLPLRDFDVVDWRMTPVSGIRCPEQQVTLTEYPSYDEMLDVDLPRVFFEPRTNHQNPDTIWLRDFEHPDDCIYVFGSAHFNPTMNHAREGDQIVTIETLQNKGVLWSNQCATIALRDRMIKRGDHNT